jgi:hypothetical protein
MLVTAAAQLRMRLRSRVLLLHCGARLPQAAWHPAQPLIPPLSVSGRVAGRVPPCRGIGGGWGYHGGDKWPRRPRTAGTGGAACVPARDRPPSVGPLRGARALAAEGPAVSAGWRGRGGGGVGVGWGWGGVGWGLSRGGGGDLALVGGGVGPACPRPLCSPLRRRAEPDTHVPVRMIDGYASTLPQVIGD